MISVKLHKTDGEILLAACDEELLGRALEDPESEIFVQISERFYGGQIIDEAALCEMLADATIANLFGKKSVTAAVNAGYINEECVLYISGVPHAQFACL